MKYTVIFLLLVSSLFVIGCASTTQVQRVGIDQTIDLSGRWNDTDSRLTSEKMITGLTASPWLENFILDQGKKPVVIIGNVRNLSDEHIQTETFIKDIERALVNSGKVTFVANRNERGELRQERLEQQSYSSEETAKRLAAEIGADFMLKGGIKTQIDAIRGKEVKYYQVDLELINVENNTKVWMDSKKIKKAITHAKHKW